MAIGNIQNFRQESWLSRLVDRKGDEYFKSGRLNSDEVSRNAERIIDDIVKSRIDYDKYGQYMVLPVILDTMISYCSNKLAILTAIQYSLGYVHNEYLNGKISHGSYMTFPVINNNEYFPGCIDSTTASNISQAIGITAQDIEIYGNIKKSLESVNITKNPYELYTLTNKLGPYARFASKRY